MTADVSAGPRLSQLPLLPSLPSTPILGSRQQTHRMEFLPQQQMQTGGAVPSPVPVLSTAALGLAWPTSHLEKVLGWGGGGQKGAMRMRHRFSSHKQQAWKDGSHQEHLQWGRRLSSPQPVTHLTAQPRAVSARG